jgi:hypothetical protein
VPWLITEPKQYPIIDEITKQSDRGAAVIAVAMLEKHLMTAIKSRLIIKNKYAQDIGEELCGEGRALGSLIPRIHAGFLLGIYRETVHSDLLKLALIRNNFAHRTTPLNFEHRAIKRLCKELHVVKNIVQPEMLGLETPKPSDWTLDKICKVVETLSMRDRFIRTIQHIITILVSQALPSYQRPTIPMFSPLDSP